MSGPRLSFATLTGVLGAVAQSGSAPRSHRGGQGFKSPQLHPLVLVSDQARRSVTWCHLSTEGEAFCALGPCWDSAPPCATPSAPPAAEPAGGRFRGVGMEP